MDTIKREMCQILTLTKKGMISITTATSSFGSDTGDIRSVDRTATISGCWRTSANKDFANVANAAYSMH